MEHDRNAIGFRGAVNDFQLFDAAQIVVGKQQLVRGVNLNHADLQPQNLLHVRHDVVGVAGMEAAARDKPLGIFLCIVGNKLIDLGSKANYVGRKIVDESGAIHAGGVQIFEKGLGGFAVLLDLLKMRPLPPDQLQVGRLDHLHRMNMNVAVSDQGLST